MGMSDNISKVSGMHTLSRIKGLEADTGAKMDQLRIEPLDSVLKLDTGEFSLCGTLEDGLHNSPYCEENDCGGNTSDTQARTFMGQMDGDIV